MFQDPVRCALELLFSSVLTVWEWRCIFLVSTLVYTFLHHCLTCTNDRKTSSQDQTEDRSAASGPIDSHRQLVNNNAALSGTTGCKIREKPRCDISNGTPPLCTSEPIVKAPETSGNKLYLDIRLANHDLDLDAVPLSPVRRRIPRARDDLEIGSRCSVCLEDINMVRQQELRRSRRSKKLRRRLSCRNCGYNEDHKPSRNEQDIKLYENEPSNQDRARGSSSFEDFLTSTPVIKHKNLTGGKKSLKSESWSEADRRKIEKAEASGAEAGQQIVHTFVGKVIHVNSSQQVQIGDNCTMESKAAPDYRDFETQSDPGVLDDDTRPALERLCSLCQTSITDDDKLSDYLEGFGSGNIMDSSNSSGSYDLLPCSKDQGCDSEDYSSQDSLDDLLTSAEICDKSCPSCGYGLVSIDDSLSSARKQSQSSSNGSCKSPLLVLTDEQKRQLFDSARRKIFLAHEEHQQRKSDMDQPFTRGNGPRKSLKYFLSKRKRSVSKSSTSSQHELSIQAHSSSDV